MGAPVSRPVGAPVNPSAHPVVHASVDAPRPTAYFRLPNTFFRMALPVPTGSARIFFSSSPIMK